MVEPYSRIEHLHLHLHLSSALAKWTRFYSEANRAVLATIRCGVLFVMAFWSGPTRLAFQELKRVLETVDPEGRLELVVVDTDGCPDISELPELVGKLHGAGETAWIREGQMVRIFLFRSSLQPERLTLCLLATLRAFDSGCSTEGGPQRAATSTARLPGLAQR